MAYETCVLDQIMGRISDPKRVGGPMPGEPRRGRASGRSSGASSSRNLLRVAGGHRSAVFKLIKRGGCADKKGLKGQQIGGGPLQLATPVTC